MTLSLYFISVLYATLRYFTLSYLILDMIEEEEAFHNYAEQRRYASTLGRPCHKNRENGEKSKNFRGGISRFVS